MRSGYWDQKLVGLRRQIRFVEDVTLSADFANDTA
jgi:hypothetical protein